MNMQNNASLSSLCLYVCSRSGWELPGVCTAQLVLLKLQGCAEYAFIWVNFSLFLLKLNVFSFLIDLFYYLFTHFYFFPPFYPNNSRKPPLY